MEIKKIVFLVFLFIPTFTQARVVNEIKIMETGAWDSDNRAEYEKEGCKTFNPTKEQLIQYFSQAQESSASGNWINEYYSPCIASGKVTFKDGDSGAWRIHSSGLGWVDFINKKRRYFYFTDNDWEKE